MRSLPWIAAIAASCLLAAPAEKQLRPGESELYNDVLKDLGAANATKALADLDIWQQKLPDSDYKDERSALYVQTYAMSNQPAKALDSASELLAKDLSSAFTGPEGEAVILRLLYNSVWAISQLPRPTPSQLASGAKAAHQLMDYDKPLPGVDAAKWAEARKDMQLKATAALVYIAILPGIQAMAKQPPDCASAESVYSKALTDYPEKSALSYELGRALNCEAKAAPEKQPLAIYEFLRAATLDPTLGDERNDKKKIQTFADNAYIRFHGSDEGLEHLRQQVKQSPLPSADFKIATAAEVEEAKAAQFEKDHPQVALWLKIKGVLSADDGAQYFESQMKDAAVPQLTGVLIEAKPACHAKELLVLVPLPDAPRLLHAEIRLKLDKPLAGKPEPNAEFQWEGVPSAFTRDPFLLTMDADTSKLQGLNLTPCTAPKRTNP
jgi:hypothetical protein